ncbi:MAG: DUF2341 domain-containing protein, partial [Verrucomicrobiota bacterium]
MKRYDFWIFLSIFLLIPHALRAQDLVLTKTVDHEVLVAGESNLIYTVTILNQGLSPASNVVVSDNLPSIVVFDTAVPAEDSFINGVLTFDLGTLSNGVSSNITIQVTADTSAASYFTNSASVTTTNAETNVANNTDSVLTTVLDFERTVEISFCGYDRTETLTNFPALVVLNTNIAGFSYEDFRSTNGYDLRFTSGDRSEILPYEIESWDTNGHSHVWVQVPELTNNASIQAYWGGANTNREAYTTNGATWSEGFEAVWHMSQTGGAIQLDSSGNGNHAIPVNYDGDEDTTNSLAGPGQAFDGSDYLAITNLFYDTANEIQAITVSGWIRTTDTGDQILASFDRSDYWRLAFDSETGNNVGWDTDSGATTDDLRPTTVISDGLWHMLAGTYEAVAGTNKFILVDGVIVGATNAHGGVGLGSGATRYGFIGNGSEATTFNGTASPADLINGDIDEFRISRVARSSNWLWAAWYTMVSNDQFTCFGRILEVGQTNLSLTKSVDLDAVSAPTNLIYTLTICNAGFATMDEVRITDTLPVGAVFVSSTPTPARIVGSDYGYDFGMLEPDATEVLTINVSIEDSATGILTNSATVYSTTSESNLVDNTANAETRLEYPDLVLTKSVDRTVSLNAASNLVYTIQLVNQGLIAADNVVVTDSLPALVTFVSSSPTPTNMTNGLLGFDVGTLAPGEQRTFTLQVTPPSNVSAVITNTATAYASNEQIVSNNTDSVTTDLLLVKYGMKIGLCGYDRAETLTNFPALVVLGPHIDGFSYTNFSSPDGHDLRFTDQLFSNVLPYEIESWDTNGRSYVWVQVAELVPTTTIIRALWGHTNATREAYTTNGATWSEGYEAVWHMGESNILDSAANGRHGAPVGAPAVTTGIVHSSIQFDGTNDYFTIPGYPGVTGQDDRTMSLWLNNNADENDVIMSWGQDTAGDKWVYRFEADGNLRVEVNGGNDTTANEYSDGIWHHVAFTLADDGSPNITEGN